MGNAVINVPIQIRASVPGNDLARTYTAVFVVKALKNTVPRIVDSG